MTDMQLHEFDELEPSSEKWGKANDRRGKRYADLALSFVADFPIGTHLTAEQFDAWLQESGLLTVPATYVAKNSDAWLGHLQRRHIIRNRINTAAVHPRMAETAQGVSFILVAIRGGFEVQSPQVAASKAELPRKIRSLTETKRKQLSYLMQSADWSALPIHEQAIASEIYDDIDNFVVDTKTGADRISRKLARLEHRLAVLMDTGAVKPTNGGLKQLLSPVDRE